MCVSLVCLGLFYFVSNVFVNARGSPCALLVYCAGAPSCRSACTRAQFLETNLFFVTLSFEEAGLNTSPPFVPFFGGPTPLAACLGWVRCYVQESLHSPHLGAACSPQTQKS